jgi:hypothetical protein
MPAPSPPGLKSSIEYFAMSVGIGGTLIVGFIPRMVVRPRSAALRACLAEDFVSTSSATWCKNRDLPADDIKQGGRV